MFTEIVESIEYVVDGQFKGLDAPMIRNGEFRLVKTYKQFRRSKSEWSPEEQGIFFDLGTTSRSTRNWLCPLFTRYQRDIILFSTFGGYQSHMVGLSPI